MLPAGDKRYGLKHGISPQRPVKLVVRLPSVVSGPFERALSSRRLRYLYFTRSLRSSVFSRAAARRRVFGAKQNMRRPRDTNPEQKLSRRGEEGLPKILNTRSSEGHLLLTSMMRGKEQHPEHSIFAYRPRNNSPRNRDQDQKTTNVLWPQRTSGNVTRPGLPSSLYSALAPMNVALSLTTLEARKLI